MTNPKNLIKEIGRKYPNVWQDIKSFRSGRGKDLPNWPDWCYMPIAGAYSIVFEGLKYLHPSKLRLSPAVIAAAAAWRVTKGIYRFDTGIYDALVSQPMDSNIPCNALKRLPEWCIYIETQGTCYLGKPIIGFWAHLEWDVKIQREELRFIFFYEDTGMNQLAVHLGDWTIEVGLDKMLLEAKQLANEVGIRYDASGHASRIAPEVTPFIQLILYLCSENVDMPRVPAHPRTRVRMSGQVDVPKEATIWCVGERIGAAIRKYHTNNYESTSTDIITELESHSSPRPHIRRAHWHHYWTGPKHQQQLILRWLPPIPVGIEDDAGPTVIHKVIKN